VASLPAKRNMQINAQWSPRRRRALEGGVHIAHVIRTPERVRRVVGDEIAASFGLLENSEEAIIGSLGGHRVSGRASGLF
jgi:hypothetical protein